MGRTSHTGAQSGREKAYDHRGNQGSHERRREMTQGPARRGTTTNQSYTEVPKDQTWNLAQTLQRHIFLLKFLLQDIALITTYFTTIFPNFLLYTPLYPCFPFFASLDQEISLKRAKKLQHEENLRQTADVLYFTPAR